VIVVIGPLPTPENERDGMMQRIAAIDRLLDGDERVYLAPRQDPLRSPDFALEAVRPGVRAAAPNIFDPRHLREMRALAARARTVVVHSVHQAQLAMPLYGLGHVVTDLHGAVPEEQAMIGQPPSPGWFDRIERFVVARSRALIAVTDAMADHVRRKYPDLSPTIIVLPMMSTVSAPPQVDKPVPPRWRLLYAGGVHRWQNIDRMLAALRRCPISYEMDFLTPDVARAQRMVADSGLASRVRVRTLSPAEMPLAYAQAHLAFVLRDDHPINRVSCPTKLQEALAHGLVPIVDCAEIGDFARMGYRYVRVSDFESGRLPETDSWQAMVAINRDVHARLAKRAGDAAEQLRRTIEVGRSGADAGDELSLFAELLLAEIAPYRERLQRYPVELLLKVARRLRL
jgi:hypothetical protein